MEDENALELAGLRQLALRLLTQVGYDVSPERTPELLVGRVPSEPPIELPLPEDARIVGSVIGERRSDTFFDTDESIESLRTLYYGRMADLGWLPMTGQNQTRAPREGGCVHGGDNSQSLYEIFCRDESGPSCTIKTSPPRNGITPVQVTFQVYKRPRESPLWHRTHGLFDPLPPLYAPDGDEQQPAGGSSSHDEVWNQARLTTGLNLRSVGDHYKAQLVNSGWVLEANRLENSGSEIDEGTAWSYWRFTDDRGRPWQGSFTALCHPDTPHNYQLMVHARLASDSMSQSTEYSHSVSASSVSPIGAQRHDSA